MRYRCIRQTAAGARVLLRVEHYASTMSSGTCVGVDVGGARKGFHVAELDSGTLIGLHRFPTAAGVMDWLRGRQPAAVAIDSPRRSADPGERSREGERKLAREVCGIRWTPEESKLAGNGYYGWIENGLKLYRALEAERPDYDVIEVFPTASFTKWAGPRESQRRAAWTSSAILKLRSGDLPPRRLSQNDRDAIAAAVTARQYEAGDCAMYGDIAVPTRLP